MLAHYDLNTQGRDLIVGDIHGCFSRLRADLDRVGFDPAVDRLFATGDLIDRGPESIQVLDWLQYPWFHSVRGNHDNYAVEYKTCNWSSWAHYGGYWFQCLEDAEQALIASQLDLLPMAIEIDTPTGLVAVVHADPIVHDWHRAQTVFAGLTSKNILKGLISGVMNSRSRYEQEDLSLVKNVRAVVVGHQPLACKLKLGNVHYIDTGGWMPVGGHFTLLNLATLQTEPVRVTP